MPPIWSPFWDLANFTGGPKKRPASRGGHCCEQEGEPACEEYDERPFCAGGRAV